MSPRAALESPVFGYYVALVVGVAVVSWLSIFVLGRFGRRDVSHAWQSYRAWLIMAPAVLLVLFLGRIVAVAFIFGLAAIGFLEYARATGLTRDRLFVANSQFNKRGSNTAVKPFSVVSIPVSAFAP